MNPTGSIDVDTGGLERRIHALERQGRSSYRMRERRQRELQVVMFAIVILITVAGLVEAAQALKLPGSMTVSLTAWATFVAQIGTAANVLVLLWMSVRPRLRRDTAGHRQTDEMIDPHEGHTTVAK